MSDTLSQWHVDHVNFAKLLDLLEDEFTIFHDGSSPNYELMLEIMYYMTHYPDVLHHPKEDLIFAMIKERDPNAARQVDLLTEQHASLMTSGAQLVCDLDEIVNGSIMPRERVDTEARVYVANFRDHMRVEELELVPMASRLLRQEDWSAIDTAIRHLEDPLFGSRTQERYAGLAEHIARQSKSEGHRRE